MGEGGVVEGGGEERGGVGGGLRIGIADCGFERSASAECPVRSTQFSVRRRPPPSGPSSLIEQVWPKIPQEAAGVLMTELRQSGR